MGFKLIHESTRRPVFLIRDFTTFRAHVEWDQIGRFLKVFGNNFLNKVAQNIGNVLGYFEKPHCYVKTAVCYFFDNFWEYFGYVLLQHLVTLRPHWIPKDQICSSNEWLVHSDMAMGLVKMDSLCFILAFSTVNIK